MSVPTRLRHVLVLLAAAVGAACASRPYATGALPSPVSSMVASERKFSFRTFEVPGARRTVASGIDDIGQIVGYYDDSAAATHGFVLSGGTFGTLDFPGAAFSQALGIGARGEIVGTYRMPSESALNFHGFLRSPNGRFARIDYPGHSNTIAQRILSDGTILGCRHDNDFAGSMKGVVIGTQDHSETQAFASMHNGATPDLRRIAGLYNYASGDRSSAYVIDDGEFKPLVVPGSIGTSAWDVNPAGEIVGSFRDSTGVHGFILAAEGFSSINVPNAVTTHAFGINASGTVVGSFVAGGRTAGFVATPTGGLRAR